jgi:hypothetical protein
LNALEASTAEAHREGILSDDASLEKPFEHAGAADIGVPALVESRI